MKRLLFPFLIFVLICIFSLLKIHGSSIGIYHNFFFKSKDKNLIFGQPRPIRSDEWLVSTSHTISQWWSKFNHRNPYLIYGQEMSIIYESPTSHWSTIFKPYNWSFFILPLENAFAFKWWLRGGFLIIGSFLFFNLLIKNYFLSILISFILFFTPYYQWWYSNGSTLEILSAFFFMMFFLMKIIDSKKVLSLLKYGIFFVFFSLVSFFVFYPPILISLFWVFLGFAGGYLLKKKHFIKNNSKLYLLIFLLIVIIDLLIILKFYSEFKDIINIIRNTIYPGKRFVANTLGDFLFLINGFYNIQLLDDFKGSGPFGNQSEASNFFLLSLFALPVYFWVVINQIKNKKIDWIFLSFNTVFIILLIWFLFPIPSIIAKISLLFLVPQRRAIVGIGIASYLLMFYFLTKMKPRKDSFYLFLVFLCSFIIFFVNLYLGFWLKFNYPAFIQNNLKIILISLFSAILMYLLLMQKAKLFLILLLIFSFISTYRVNPLYKGLSPLIDTPLAKELRKIDRIYESKYRWLAYGSIYLENYFIANGLKSLNGTYFYPQFSLWHKFDKERKYENIYNRYAHVTLFDDPTKEKFILHAPDYFSFNLNPCDSSIKNTDFKLFLFENKVNYGCLKLIKQINNKFFIYKSNL